MSKFALNIKENMNALHHHFFKIAIGVAFLIAGQSKAYAVRPPVINYTRETSGAGTQNWGIAQGAGGLMYFANNGGLLSFDSRSWTLLPAGNYTSVRSVYFAPDSETLYIGASASLESLRMSRDGELERHSLLEELQLDVAEIWNIFQDGGNLYFQDNNRLFRISEKGVPSQWHFDARISCSGCFGGQILVALQDGRLFSLFGETFSPLPGTESLRRCNIRFLSEKPDGLIIATESDGIFRYEGFQAGKTGLLGDHPPGDIFCGAASERYLALGTISEGLWIKDLQTGEQIHLDRQSGLLNNTVLSLRFDREGNLWAGLDNGISYIWLGSPEWKILPDGETGGTGYASALFDGRYWFGTNQGLFRTRSIDDDTPVESIAGIRWQVWSLDSWDNALFCSHDKGLDIFYPDGSRDRIPLNGCWKIEPLRRHPGHLLGCTYDRIFLLSRTGNGKWRFERYPEGFEAASKAFEEDYDGSIWLSHHIRGLYRLKFSDDLQEVEATGPYTEAQGFPTSRNNYPNEYGDAIVFSTEGGFFRFDDIAARAIPIDALNGIFTGVPYAAKIYRPEEGVEYFSSGSIQTVRLDKGDGSFLTDSLSLKHLSAKRPLGFESTLYLPKRGFIINTDEGFSLVNTSRLRASHDRPLNVFISEIRISGNQRDSVIYRSRSPRKEITVRIPRRSNSVTLSYICPVYRKDGNILYRCMLEGYDKDWTPMGVNLSKEYTRLPGGNYLFRVEARDPFGGEPSEDRISLQIEPPLYQTPAAYALYLLLLIGLVAGIARLVGILSLRRAADLTRKREEQLRAQQTDLELRHRADELAASTSNLIRKNEILYSIDADLSEVKKRIADGEKPSQTLARLSEIRQTIRDNIQHDDDWQRFSKHFDLVYDHFIERLGREFPALSTSDKRLCAYLKMGLSSKDIAPLLNMTLRSVEMTRHRLRRKLGLSHDENLVRFLQEF